MKVLFGKLRSLLISSEYEYGSARFHHGAKRIMPFILVLGLAGANLDAQRLWQPDYNDANGWINPVYGTTIMLGDINGDGRADVCGRGIAGIYCALSNGTSFGPVIFATSNFSDAFGWAASSAYYGSIRLGDVNGDGRADICGRGGAGIYCALSNGNGTFASLQLWQPDYTDANGWINPVYGTTIMLGDINRDGRADVCGRGIAGIYCALSNGSSFGPVIFTTDNFSDALGWAASSTYYGSIRLGDVNGDGLYDVCGRGGAGIYCGVATVVFGNGASRGSGVQFQPEPPRNSEEPDPAVEGGGRSSQSEAGSDILRPLSALSRRRGRDKPLPASWHPYGSDALMRRIGPRTRA